MAAALGMRDAKTEIVISVLTAVFVGALPIAPILALICIWGGDVRFGQTAALVTVVGVISFLLLCAFYEGERIERRRKK